jgi:hypothetical protein
MGNEYSILFPRAIAIASEMENMLKVLYRDVEVKVFAAKILHKPISVIFDIFGNYKFIIIYRPINLLGVSEKQHQKVANIEDIRRLHTMLKTLENLLGAGSTMNTTLTLDECALCMDNHINTVLPCLHAFCEKCCSEWRGTNPTCPSCREELISPRDDWMLEQWTESDLKVAFVHYCRNIDVYVSSLDNVTDESLVSHKILNQI